MNLIDKTANFNDWTNKSPDAKLALGFGVLLLSLWIERPLFHLILTVFLLILMVGFAKIPLSHYLRLMKVPTGFLVLSLIAILLSFSKDPSVFLRAVPLGGTYMGITQVGVERGWHLATRAIAGITSTYLMALTTPIMQWVKVLAKIHCPPVVIELLVLIYRFITIFMDEFTKMENAIAIKGGNRTAWLQIKNTALLGSNIFERIMNSYDNWSNLLELKMYNGTFYY